ncbi:MAG: ATP-binding cassette domain-containing protein [Sphingobacteriia bacterium]|nr:ATP-binding cassette domain-containing protein [Sphingobacteriia bacterium]
MLIITDLHVEINHKEVLKGINLSVPEHEVHALFGPNGSGKSVLISVIMGYPEFQITKGEIVFNGIRINNLTIDERVRMGISAMEQRPPVIKGVTLGKLAEMMVRTAKRNVNDITGLSGQYDMNRFLGRDINDGFSGGEIKKAEMFSLILARPSFVILDEPDSGVDPEHLKTIGKMINQSLNIRDIPGERCKQWDKNSGIIATHSAAVLDYVHTDKAHIMIDGQIKCTGNTVVLMTQIRDYGYEYCIKCQKTLNDDNKN